MAEIGGHGADRPIDTLATGLSDTTPVREGEGVFPAEETNIVDNEQIYLSIKRMRAMAAGLGVSAARSGDGIYDHYAHVTLAAAGILRKLLVERGSRYVAILQDEEATEPNRTGVRQLPLH